MPDQPPVVIHSDPVKNFATMRYAGRVAVPDMQAALSEVERLLPQLRPGFTVLSDLSGLESMDLDCVPHLTKIMDVSRAHGVGTVVRVIPDSNKDIGFNILSIIHYRRGVQIITCENMTEAERALAPTEK
jgi:hypothetical protein